MQVRLLTSAFVLINTMKNFEVQNLKEIIAGYFPGEFTILEEKSRMLTAPGDHYGSIMLAVDVKIEAGNKQQTFNLVAKLIPASEMLREAFDIYVTFKKEVNAYIKAIPALIKLQREYNVPEEKILDIFPKCYGARLSLDKNKDKVDEDAALIFENLKVQGYGSGDRFKGFDLAHAKLCVQDLAKLHALPIALRKLKPAVFESEIRPCLAPNFGLDRLPDDVRDAFVDSIICVGKTIPEVVPYISRMEQLVNDGFEAFKKPRPPPKDSYGTIVHADYWVNNTMILWDENGNPIKNKIVDLQIMQYDTGIKDLIFFLFTSVTNSVLKNNYNELVQLYHNTFVDYLKDFNIDLAPYSWENFVKEMEETGPKEFMHIAFMLKPIFTEKGKINSLDEFQPSDWSRRDLIGPAHANKLKEFILAFAQRKWL